MLYKIARSAARGRGIAGERELSSAGAQGGKEWEQASPHGETLKATQGMTMITMAMVVMAMMVVEGLLVFYDNLI